MKEKEFVIEDIELDDEAMEVFVGVEPFEPYKEEVIESQYSEQRYDFI